MDAAAELGRNPISKHQIQPEYGDEQADAGRDGWTRLARPNSQARTGTGEYYFPCSADLNQDWQPRAVDPYSAICDGHTYIHTSISEADAPSYFSVACLQFMFFSMNHSKINVLPWLTSSSSPTLS